MSVSKPTLWRTLRRPAWPEAVQIVARRKVLAENYRRLVGEIRSHRSASNVYTRNPSLTALLQVGRRGRRLDAVLGRYMRTLAELRGAVEVVFPAGKSGSGTRRTRKRSRR
jgi:hypothetical protein